MRARYPWFPMKTILAPVDFSGVTKSVVAAAGALAQALNGRVVLVHVVRPPAVINEYAPEIERLADLASKSATQQMALCQKELRNYRIDVDVVQSFGVPVANILEQARRLEADYIVMGSHGHSALYGLLAGSTASGVLKKAGCPVVIVPPGEKHHAAAIAEAQTRRAG